MRRKLAMTNAYFTRLTSIIISSLLLLFTINAMGQQRPEYHIKIENHLFYPAKIDIPVNTKVKLIISNYDETVEEFDSFSLNREKVIFPNQKAIIFIGPLPEGEYRFFGEYHPHSARGTVVVVKNPLTQTTESGAQHVN